MGGGYGNRGSRRVTRTLALLVADETLRMDETHGRAAPLVQLLVPAGADTALATQQVSAGALGRASYSSPAEGGAPSRTPARSHTVSRVGRCERTGESARPPNCDSAISLAVGRLGVRDRRSATALHKLGWADVAFPVQTPGGSDASVKGNYRKPWTCRSAVRAPCSHRGARGPASGAAASVEPSDLSSGADVDVRSTWKHDLRSMLGGL
jgi:hypothetical protein